MKEVYVIIDKDLDDGEEATVGVSTDLHNANKMIGEYYGEYKEILFRDVRDSGVEFTKVIEWGNNKYRSEVIVLYFNINEL